MTTTLSVRIDGSTKKQPGGVPAGSAAQLKPRLTMATVNITATLINTAVV